MTPRPPLAAIALALPAALAAQTPIAVPDAPDATVQLLKADPALDPAARAAAALDAAAPRHGGLVQRAKPMTSAVGDITFHLQSAAFADAPTRMMVYMTHSDRPGVCEAGVPIADAARNARAIALACRAALADLGGSAAPAPAAATAAAPVKAAPAAHSGNWAKVAGVYFRSGSGIGGGGMVTISYSPVVLFTDGSYYEPDDAALEDIDLAAERAAHPRRFGRWTGGGTRFVLTETGGKPNDYQLQQGNFFKAFPAGAAPLAGPFKATGGGGNAAMGGDVFILTQSILNFGPGGRFSTSRETGALNSGNTTGVGSTVRGGARGGGSYSVDRHTLTLRHADGKTERRFFAFASHKTPPQVDKDMIFVGDTPYLLDD